MSDPILHFLHEHLSFEITNRHGGVSCEPYEALNLAYHVGDTDTLVRENRRHVMERLGLSGRVLIYMNQTHSDEVFIANQAWVNLHSHQFEVEVTADSVICDAKNAALLVMVADCNPILLYDSRQHIIAVVHAGRKGVELRILSKTFQKMQQHFHSNICDMYAMIGAGIRACCYEVKQDVAQIFCRDCFPSDTLIRRDDKIFLNLLAPLKQEWQQLGAKAESLYIDTTCTACCHDYYSFRREQRCGRFGIVAGIK